MHTQNLIFSTYLGDSFGLQVQHFDVMVVCVRYIQQLARLSHTQASRLVEAGFSETWAKHIARFPIACQHLALFSLRVYYFDLEQKATLCNPTEKTSVSAHSVTNVNKYSKKLVKRLSMKWNEVSESRTLY